MKSAPTQQTPTPNSLRVNDLLFITEYLKNGRNGTQAYMTVHPGSKYTSSEVSAHRLLSKARVQVEIARRIQHEGGITKAFCESSLMTALQLAHDQHDPAVIASVTMDCAKLAGFLIEKREVRTMSEEQSDHVRRIVASALTPTRPQPLDPAKG